MAPTAERPDKAMALRLIDDLGKVDAEHPKMVDASIFLLEQNMYLTDQVESMPETTANAVMAQLNGQVGKLVDAHALQCSRDREAQAAEDADHEDVSSPKKMLGYLLKHNSYVFGAVVIAAMLLFREPFNALLMNWIP